VNSAVTALPACPIRPGAPGDEAALALLGQATFLEAFAGVLRGSDILSHCTRAHSRSLYGDWLRDPRARVWVAETAHGAAMVGYLVLTAVDLPLPDIDPADFEIKRVYLLHRFQGAGIGRRLMDAARAHAQQHSGRRLLLGVYSQNSAAISFYQALGYQTVGSRTFRVGDTDCSDLILALPLAARAG